MKATPVISIAIFCLLLAGCVANNTVQSDRPGTIAGPAAAQQTTNSAEEFPLYLHLLTPRYYTTPPMAPRRIVTARVELGNYFAVKVHCDSDITLAGRIERGGGKYFARHLSGLSGGTKNFADGEMELEKPCWSKAVLGSGGVWRAVFVLSTNSNCQGFLKQIDSEAQ